MTFFSLSSQNDSRTGHCENYFTNGLYLLLWSSTFMNGGFNFRTVTFLILTGEFLTCRNLCRSCKGTISTFKDCAFINISPWLPFFDFKAFLTIQAEREDAGKGKKFQCWFWLHMFNSLPICNQVGDFFAKERANTDSSIPRFVPQWKCHVIIS